MLLRIAEIADANGEGVKVEPDYSQPGEFGKSALPNLIFIWDRVTDPDGYWKKLPFKKPASDCDELIVEVDYVEAANPCPPAEGFAPSVQLALHKARDEASVRDCPDDCQGSLTDTIYEKWDCKGGNLRITVQVRRICWVI